MRNAGAGVLITYARTGSEMPVTQQRFCPCCGGPTNISSEIVTMADRLASYKFKATTVAMNKGHLQQLKNQYEPVIPTDQMIEKFYGMSIRIDNNLDQFHLEVKECR